ncbi:MAG: hypothetical protein DCF19_15780 [Pseudanabaena frigida]|uniref:Serine aminopeptidase S33 domain-containing protein n=1 Tax=Pseudanabaena frigida TaxID=945775 RepID=A0A2W4W2W5_9CYAN|nr:MAG: hypothetical protein DCF19_15780 [Pseudanabaena frigida]
MYRLRIWNRHLAIIVGILVLSIGLFLNIAFYPYAINTETINLPRDRIAHSQSYISNSQPQKSPNSNSDRKLVGRLYIPPQVKSPYPTIMLWHGVSSTKEMVEPLAIELARHGIAALSFDSGGFGESYSRNYSVEENLEDARAVFAYVKKHPERFDPNRLGIGGHSMGAATAIAFASDPIDASKVRVTLDLGMSADVNLTRPNNLFMGIGLYEEFHTPDAMREMLSQSTGVKAKEFKLYGNFSNGTARKLIISGTSDHLMEPFDPTLIGEAVQWSMQAFELKETSVNPITLWVISGSFLTLIGMVMTIGYGIRDLTIVHTKPRLLALAIVAIAALILFLGMSEQISPRIATSLVLVNAIILPVTTYAIKRPHSLTPFFRLCGLYIGVVSIAYAIVLIVIRCMEIFNYPLYLLGVPQFILQLPIFLIYARVQEFSAAMFPIYSNGLVPSWQITLLFLPELVYPSIVISFGVRVSAWLIRWLRQPLKLKWIERPSPRSFQLLGILIVVLVIVIIQQAQAGLVSIEYAIGTMQILLQMMFLPALVMILIIRSTQFQRLERKLS